MCSVSSPDLSGVCVRLAMHVHGYRFVILLVIPPFFTKRICNLITCLSSSFVHNPVTRAQFSTRA